MTTATRPGSTETTDDTEQLAARPTRRDWLWWAAITAVFLVPLLVSAADVWFSVRSSYFPHADLAMIELRTRDVFHHVVTTGAYSRFGNQHPGPLLFYTLALPYKLLGSSSVALNVAALLINGLTVVAMLWIAMRRGGLPMVLATIVPVALLVHHLGAEQLRDPWNATLPSLPLLLVLLLAWSVAVGDVWMLPFAVAVASFAMQTHLGFTVDVVSLLAVGVLAAVIRAVRHRAAGAVRPLVWAGVVSLAVGIVVWLPVIYGTFVRHDGNVQATIDVFTSNEPRLGLTTALRVLAPVWGATQTWAFGTSTGTDSSPWGAVVGVALLAGAAGVAWWRKAADFGWLVALVGVGAVAAVYSVSSILGDFADYLVRWTLVLGAALGIVVLRAIWLALPTRFRAAGLRFAVPVVLVLVTLISLVNIRDIARAPSPQEIQEDGVHDLWRGVAAALPPGRGPVLIDAPKEFFAVTGMVLQLERHGIPVRVTRRSAFSYAYGPDRLHPARDPRAVLTIVPERAVGAPPGREIAASNYLFPADYRRSIPQQIRALEATPPSAARDAQIEKLRSRRHPVRITTIYLSRRPAG